MYNQYYSRNYWMHICLMKWDHLVALGWPQMNCNLNFQRQKRFYILESLYNVSEQGLQYFEAQKSCKVHHLTIGKHQYL